MAGQSFDALNIVDDFFEPLGDFRLDDLGIRAGINGGHTDDRRINIGQLANRQTREANHTKEDQREAHHRGEDRALDADAGKGHVSKSE